MLIYGTPSTPDWFWPRWERLWSSANGVVLALVGYCIKARKEEEMLTQQFGDAFREHQKHAGFLLPRVR